MRQLALPVAMILVALAGCDSTGKTVEYNDNGGPGSSWVFVYSPAYDGGTSRPVVEVIWDGKTLFSGKLPLASGRMTGMPNTLIQIETNPGPHTIEVICGEESQKIEFRVEDGHDHSFRIFGLDKEQKNQLLLDIGADVGLV
jgi:hypothetical protein